MKLKIFTVAICAVLDLGSIGVAQETMMKQETMKKDTMMKGDTMMKKASKSKNITKARKKTTDGPNARRRIIDQPTFFSAKHTKFQKKKS